VLQGTHLGVLAKEPDADRIAAGLGYVGQLGPGHCVRPHHARLQQALRRVSITNIPCSGKPFRMTTVAASTES